jgi:hypothetical protein
MRLISCVLVALFLGACVSAGGSDTTDATKKDRVFQGNEMRLRD